MDKQERALYNKTYHKVNKEKIKARKKKYYQANKEKYIALAMARKKVKKESI